MKSRIIKKIYLVIVVMIVVVLMGFGCTPIGNTNCDESNIRSAMYKPDRFHYSGQAAVCYDDKIYFVSQEKTKEGIYSMDYDGGNIKFEYEVPKISKLIVIDSAIYYVGLSDIVRKNQKLYGLFRIETSDASTEQVKSDYEHSDSVFDAYLLRDGTIAMLETYSLNSSLPESEVLSFIGAKANYVEGWANSFYQEGDQFRYNTYFDEVGGFIFSSGDVKEYNDTFEQVNVIDESTGNLVLNSISRKSSNHIKLLGLDDDLLIFGEDNSLVFVNRLSREKGMRISIENWDSNMWIDYVYMCNKRYFVVAKNDYGKMKLYGIDVEESQSEELATFNNSKIFLHVQEDRVYYAQANKIICQFVSNEGLGEKIFEIKLPKRVGQGNLFEIAGDWLFIYEKSNSEEPNKLLYRVNLETQEAVDLR